MRPSKRPYGTITRNKMLRFQLRLTDKYKEHPLKDWKIATHQTRLFTSRALNAVGIRDKALRNKIHKITQKYFAPGPRKITGDEFQYMYRMQYKLMYEIVGAIGDMAIAQKFFNSIASLASKGT